MSLKIADSQKDLISYLKFQIEGRKEVSVILYFDTLLEFIDELKSYGRKLASFSCETDSNSEIYVITKYLNEINQECLMIEPLYQFNTYTVQYESIYVKDECVLVEEYCLDEEEIEEIIKSDEYEIIGLAEDHPELDECDCYECKGCSESCCNGKYIKDNTHIDEEFEDYDEVRDIQDYLECKFNEYKHDPDMTMDELLLSIYLTGFESGRKQVLLSLREDIDLAIED